jgi:hypothetical protein
MNMKPDFFAAKSLLGPLSAQAGHQLVLTTEWITDATKPQVIPTSSSTKDDSSRAKDDASFVASQTDSWCPS